MVEVADCVLDMQTGILEKYLSGQGEAVTVKAARRQAYDPISDTDDRTVYQTV